MNKIDTIHINNFKFFPKSEPIKLGGNHMLLYGENGSGKSSIYWALYTLFEASLKPSDNEIRKYFSKTIKIEDNLINIHAVPVADGVDDYDSFVEVRTDDNPAISPFRISVNDVAIRSNTSAKNTNYASDFINYRMLLSLSSFRHSHKIDLFEMFVEDVFKYVQFARVEITRAGTLLSFTNAFDIWQQIELGFEMVPNGRGDLIMAYKNSPPYNELVTLINSFNESLQKLVDYINIHGPRYFEKLGYDFTFAIHLDRPADFVKGDKTYRYVPFILRLQIPEYEHVPNSIYKPHSFLNEAKLSAIAISIRLAVLSQKLNENHLKFIVLDDLLISLDMSNREKVLEVLLSPEFSSNYQLIVLTHDMPFFHVCKRKIAELGQTKWVYYEMYADEIAHIPVILPSETYYSKACYYLKRFDYPACGNYFRKAAEDIFKKDFPREVTISENGQEKEGLKNYIDNAVKLYERIGQNTAKLKALDSYLFLLLNPLSHRDEETDIYKYELNRVRDILPEVLAEVKVLNFRELIPMDNTCVIYFKFDESIS